MPEPSVFYTKLYRIPYCLAGSKVKSNGTTTHCVEKRHFAVLMASYHINMKKSKRFLNPAENIT